MPKAWTWIALGGMIALVGDVACADLFSYRDAEGRTVEVEARLAGSGQGTLLLELSDGGYRPVSEGAVVNRVVQDGPPPLEPGEIATQLEAEFGGDLFRSYVKEPYVIGLVLGTPLPRNSESRAKGVLTKAASFLKNVDAAFASFVKEARIPARPPTHPLVVLIFETEPSFEAYARSVIGPGGLSAERIAGFYSGITNRLALRLAECRTFDVPLHEAIHQQVYNRNVFRRLAPIPRWFDEGIATGFEGNQGKVSIGPTKISSRYARQVLEASGISFEQVLRGDKEFSGDVLIGEAYGRAWGLHWFLVTKYRSQYSKYVRLLAQKEPLTLEDADQRLANFREAFGMELEDLKREFRPFLESSIKKQKVVLNPERPVGISLTQEQVGEVELSAVSRNGRLEVQGRLTNVSPLRPMAFYVTVETDADAYADWHIPNLDIQKSTPLAMKYAEKPIGDARPGVSRSFHVHIRSTPADSDEAAAWKQGRLPGPVSKK
ncbi:MAG: DUF1570 domain-containing protein [Planctomycetales bacterium]